MVKNDHCVKITAILSNFETRGQELLDGIQVFNTTIGDFVWDNNVRGFFYQFLDTLEDYGSLTLSNIVKIARRVSGEYAPDEESTYR